MNEYTQWEVDFSVITMKELSYCLMNLMSIIPLHVARVIIDSKVEFHIIFLN